MSREEATRILKGPGETEFLVSRPEGSRRLVSYPGLGWFLYRQGRLVAVALNRPTAKASEPLENWISDCKVLETFPEDRQAASALRRWSDRQFCCLAFWEGPSSPEILEAVEIGMTADQVTALVGSPSRILGSDGDEIWLYPLGSHWLSPSRAVAFHCGRVVWRIEPRLLFNRKPLEEVLPQQAVMFGYVPSP